jgi:hypothetical protein
MKNLLAVVLISVSLTGCSTVKEWIPSFWDDNQSARIIDVRLKVESIDCKQLQLPQAEAVAREIRWFELYSESKGWRQNDVLKLTAPMKESVDDWVKRSREKEGSAFYCESKKKILAEQSKRAAEAILGRF